MSETSNPLNDFLNGDETTENDLFSDFTFSESSESSAEPTPANASAQPAPPANQEQPSLFEDALAKTPAASTTTAKQNTAPEDPFAAALAKAKAQSDERLAESFAEKDAVFTYGKAKDPITDRDCTFEDLRKQYEEDFPELSEAKKVSWTVTYGKVTKSIINPGSDKVYDIKAEIESSKTFLDGVKKAKTDAEKNLECTVKPRVIAQSKGEVHIPSYKDYCSSIEEAQKSAKPIVILPSRQGVLYEMRKTSVGTFIAPAARLPEFSPVSTGFQMTLPKIPMHILMFILNFFEKLSRQYRVEALVHILYDTMHGKYTIRVPKQELTRASVHSVLEEEYPEHLIHVMDIHSHNTMPARFSPIDDEDEKATRLYAVVGKLDQVFPDITVRASCAGKFIPLCPEDVFETNFKAYPYPQTWDQQIVMNEKTVIPKTSAELPF